MAMKFGCLYEANTLFPFVVPEEKMAERVGFEPTVSFHPRLISSQVPSTTQPPLLWFPAHLNEARGPIQYTALSGIARGGINPSCR